MIRHFFAAQTRKCFFLLALIVCLFVALRLWHLTTYGLWEDEVFSHMAAQLGWSELIAYVVADIVHPPLFYLLLKLWIGVGGESLLWLKLFPVLTSVATLVPLWLLCKELKLTAAEASTALFLVAVNAYLVHYAQELRMYSLLAFFTLWSLLLFVKLARAEGRQKQILAGLFVVNLLLVYTQYFGWLVVGIEGLYLLLSKRQYLLQFSIIGAGLALCFTPWAYLVFKFMDEKHGVGSNPGWLSRPTLADLTWHFAELHGSFDIGRTTSLGLILFGFPLLLLAWRVLAGKEQSLVMPFWLLVSFSFVPVVFAFLCSYLLPLPIWAERFLIISAIPYLILVAVAVHQPRPGWVKTLLLLFIIGWAGLSCVHRLGRVNHRLNWFELVRHLTQAENAEAGNVTVYVFEAHVDLPIKSALKFSGDRRFDAVRIDDMTALRGAHFWVAYRDNTWEEALLPQTFLRDLGCQVGQGVSVSTHVGKKMYVGEAVTLFPVWCQP
jgi:4-amino-4-deoxy-L-arabinose transferase-like glycosyltransferase